MRLRKLTIAGFRGVNAELELDLHDKLTVVGAPNSHGKTSITEALEFLIYGATSKVEKAQAKEEYRDSYRNRHFPTGTPAHIQADFAEGGVIGKTLRIELDADGATRRLLDGVLVEQWPFKASLEGASRPFILQHALKNLLLVPPSERFQGFAQLLGLNEVDSVHGALAKLGTKPEANLPTEAKPLLDTFDRLFARLGTVPQLKKALTAMKKGRVGAASAFQVLVGRADELLGPSATSAERMAKLVAARDEASAKVFSGSVGLGAQSPADEKRLTDSRKSLETSISTAFLEEYGRLEGRNAAEKLGREAHLLKLGIPMLDDDPAHCPFCLQAVDEKVCLHIRERQVAAKESGDQLTAVKAAQSAVAKLLKTIGETITAHKTLVEGRSAALLDAVSEEKRTRLESLLGAAANESLQLADAAAGTIRPLRENLDEATRAVRESVAACDEAISGGSESLRQAGNLAKALNEYLSKSDSLTAETETHRPRLAGVDHLLRQAIDALAGTTEIALLIDCLEKRPTIEKALRIRDLLDDVRDLKSKAEQTLGRTMDAAMNADLTAAVMKWYAKIKTVGDPDVHFSGFAMEKNKAGDYKNRKLAVRASSYGVELASAVSSLSESKLNALGLCVSIASAVRSPSPWGFLIIDDPIQSCDDEHETQFISVIRELVELEGKQVLLLSHKRAWVDAVCNGCRTIDGYHYDITGYGKDGPTVKSLDWASLEQRIREADAIANDLGATPIKQQQAEAEIRIIACQLASRVAKRKLGRDTSPHNMNANDVRAILTTAGIESNLIDRLYACCAAADDAHHAPKSYTPNIQRVRQGLAAVHNVQKLLK